MAVQLATHVPKMASDDGVIAAAKKALGKSLTQAIEHVGEITLTVERDAIVDVCRALRDTPGLEYQQLMEIAGVDFPERAERFDVNYCLLSLTKNRRIKVKVMTDEATPYMSNTSRSSQPATGQSPVTLGTGVASSVMTLTLMRRFLVSESRQ